MASTLSATIAPVHLSFSSWAAATPVSRARVGRRSSGRVGGAVSCCQSSSASSSSGTNERKEEEKWLASRRDIIAGSISAISAISTGLFALPSLALLEADDDDSLLEKVKEDRKKRIEKRGVVISLKEETESVQRAVYELSKAGQAIDGEDYGLASTVLGSVDNGWIKEVKSAISKVNKSPEEEGEAANFSAAITDLQSAVLKKDSELSKSAFVASASALEKWSSLTGLLDQIKGL